MSVCPQYVWSPSLMVQKQLVTTAHDMATLLLQLLDESEEANKVSPVSFC